MAVLPLAPIDRIIRNAGAQRVSEDARQTLRDAAEEFASKVSRRAVELARHAGRKTVMETDIKLAAKEFL